jgi:hypothetical protein
MISLEQARAEVDGWLDQVKLRTGKCSQLIRDQLAIGMRYRIFDVFAVYDEIGQLEGGDPPRPTGTKPAEPYERELRGLTHKHYKFSSFASFTRNQENHWQRKENHAELTEISNEFSVNGDAGKLAHDLVLGAQIGRHSADQVTGECIIYANIAGTNYYLTIAIHGDPTVKERVRRCFSEFPELAVHLGW